MSGGDVGVMIGDCEVAVRCPGRKGRFAPNSCQSAIGDAQQARTSAIESQNLDSPRFASDQPFRVPIPNDPRYSVGLEPMMWRKAALKADIEP